MGYVTVAQVTQSRLQSSNNSLGSLLTSLFGGGDNIQKYIAKGDSLQQIYSDWKADFTEASGILARIPTGSQKGTLTTQQNKINGYAVQLEPAFAFGAVPGAADKDTLNSYVGEVKSFVKAVNDLAAKYGIRPAAAPAATAGKPASKAAAVAQMSFLNIPLWLWGLAAVGVAIAAKKR